MRIFLNGIGAFGLDVFNKLREVGEEIVAVSAPRSSLSGRADRLFAAAEAAGIAVFEPASLKEPEVETSLRACTPELGVMAFVQEFIPLTVLNLPEHGTIQFHPSLLPLHRGRNAINWSIIQGEDKTGISIFWPDEGVDTGPVLLQKEIEIGPDDTASSLYYERMYQLGIDLLLESVSLVRAGRAPKLTQDESKGTSERSVRGRAARVDWRRSQREVYNLIRGCDPNPGAWTLFGDRRFVLTDTRSFDAPSNGPGVISCVSEDGVVIGTQDGTVIVRQLQVDGGRTAPAHEIAAQVNIQAQDVFLSPD